MMKHIVAGCLALLLTMPVVAAPPRDHDITLEDYFTQSYVAALSTSPDGRHVAWVEGRWDEALDRRNMDLWVIDTAARMPRRLTFDDASDTNPQWSADGRWLYFSSSRKQGDAERPPYNGKRQVWRINVANPDAAPTPVTRVEDGIGDYAISADGSMLYYTTDKKHNELDPWKKLREKFSDIEYGDGLVDFSVVHALDLTTWRSEKIIDDDRVIIEFAPSPSGDQLAMITAPTGELITNEGWSRVDVWDVETKSMTTLEDRLFREEAPSPYGWIVSLCWSGDGDKLAFRVDFDGYPGEIFAAHFDAGATSPPVTHVPRPDGNTPGEEVSAEGHMAWQPGQDALCFIGEDHARARVYTVRNISPDGVGGSGVLTAGDVVISDFSFARDAGDLAVVKADLTTAGDIYMARTPGDNLDRLTTLNPQVDTWKLPQLRIVNWTSDDGTEVEGLLELPPEYTDGDGPLPLHVIIHGGPTASSKYAFRYWVYGRAIYAANGWAVFDPNYRGSTGYGDTFLKQLINNKNNLDVQDILSGVNMLIREGIADENQMAVSGWSNGGYLTNCVIAADNRFKGASSGAGVFDTAMQWSIEDTPGHVVNYSGGLPWNRAEKMRATSPLYQAHNITTPTVIHVGENDPRVPAAHSRSMHRALHHYLNIPTELLVYPGEGHGLSKMKHRKAKLEWDMAWMEHHVLGKSAEDVDE